MIKTVKYNGVDVVEALANLAHDVTKVLPHIILKPEDKQTYGVDKDIYPHGIGVNFLVYEQSDLNNHIGKLFVENYRSETPKLGIQSINIDDGRTSWGVDGEYKQSIHAKNIIRIAKKVFKPLTFEQIANKTRNNFKRKIESIRGTMGNRLRAQTCSDIKRFKDDLLQLKAIGYSPVNPMLIHMMDYVTTHLDEINKYDDYSPNHYFVLVKDKEVQYAMIDGKTNKMGEPTIIKTKDELPEDVKGKLFVLDITEGKDFVDDIGLKENDGAYWIIA